LVFGEEVELLTLNYNRRRRRFNELKKEDHSSFKLRTGHLLIIFYILPLIEIDKREIHKKDVVGI